jgi:signal transduction histidine kinase
MVLRMKDAASTMLRNHEISFHTNGQPFTDVKDIEFRRNLLLVYKEMLHNVLKHACATRVEISLLENDGKLELCIHDYGTGFDEGSVTRGNGLKNMRARAVKLGGSLQIESTPDKGTLVVLTAIIP